MLNRIRERNAFKASFIENRMENMEQNMPPMLPPGSQPVLPSQSRNPMIRALSTEVSNGDVARKTAFHMIDPSQGATKNAGFSQYVQDFIYSNGVYNQPYTDIQLELAYMTSVYLFAALRRVSNLVSRVKTYAEVKRGGKWTSLNPESRINVMLARDMPSALKFGYLNYAVYGAALAYKTKTFRAVMQAARGKPIYDYKDGAVGGFIILDKPGWELDESPTNNYASLKGAQIGYDYRDIIGERNYLKREEFIYMTDWNPRDRNRGRSIATVAIHEAVTNAAIARWASEYFTRGTLPMLLVSMVDNPAVMTETDLLKQKRFFEENLQGQGSSLRTTFVDQKVDVQEIGISADRVAAPELNKTALEGISAAVGIERDLIIAPEGGTQSRHEAMIQQAWTDTIIPLAEWMIDNFQRDLGLPKDCRIQIDVSHIAELEANRGDRATTELQMFEKTAQTINETRMRLNQKPIKALNGFMMTANGLTSIRKILQQDKIVDEKLFSQITAGWDADLLKKSDALKMMGKALPPNEKDGYKSQLTASEGGGVENEQIAAEADGGTPAPIEASNEVDGKPTKSDPLIEEQTFEPDPDDDLSDFDDDYVLAGDDLDETVDSGEQTAFAPDFITASTTTITLPADNTVFGCIDLSNDVVISEMQRKLMRSIQKNFMRTSTIKWTDPKDFHLTLIFAENVSVDKFSHIESLMPNKFEAVKLNLGPLVVFDKAGKTSICIAVEKTTILESMHQSLVQPFQSYIAELGEFTNLSHWIPHVTIATIQTDPNFVLPDFAYRAAIMPSFVKFVRHDDSVVARIPIIPEHQSLTVVPDIHYLDKLDEALKLFRSNLTEKLMLAKSNGDLSVLPEALIDCITEFNDRPDVFDASLSAINNGYFDDDAYRDGNPITKYLKGYQTDAIEELKAWKKVAINNPTKAKTKFQVSVIPVKIEAEIRSELQSSTKSDSSNVEEIFAKALKQLQSDLATRPIDEEALNGWLSRMNESGDDELSSLIKYDDEVDDE